MAKPKAKAPHSADTRAKEGLRGFAGIPRCVIESEAYRRLSLIGRAILVEIVVRMRGDNNGEIHVSYAELAKCLNRKNQAPIGPAIAELMQHGLLDLSAESVWQERKSREYRLTFVNTSDSIGRPIKATNEYLAWNPSTALIDATDAVADEGKSATPFVASKVMAATEAVADDHVKLPKTVECSATNGVIPILKPYAAPRSMAADPSSNLIGFPSRAGVCEQCSESFAPAGRGQPKRFCGEPCRKRAEARRRNQRRAQA